MGEAEPVSKDVCKVIHKNVDEKFENLDCCIKEIRDAVNEMRDISSSNKEIIKILMEERNQRSTKNRVWEAPWFKFVIITACIVTIAIIGAAIGNNMLDKYIEALKLVEGG